MSTVFYAPFKSCVDKASRLDAVLDRLETGCTVTKNALIAVKLHFGERGNDTFVRPYFVRQVVDAIKAAGGKPYLTDSNTLYKHMRHNAVDHLETAIRHGFDYAVTGAPMVIADGIRGFDHRDVPIDGVHFSNVLISPAVVDADDMVVISHFKGHPMAGFGGAIKNLAMGCAPAQGKRDQHAAKVMVQESKCIACGACAPRCPVQAITVGNTAHINNQECMACGNCLQACPEAAIDINWKTDIAEFGQRMAEYALGAVKGKKRPLYINFLMDMTPGCDCHTWSDPAIMADLGILGSDDPVALDKACYDLVKTSGQQQSKFQEIYPRLKPLEQLVHAEKLGMGSQTYTLETI
jgi:uncharacterized Fe-S center protein